MDVITLQCETPHNHAHEWGSGGVERLNMENWLANGTEDTIHKNSTHVFLHTVVLLNVKTSLELGE